MHTLSQRIKSAREAASLSVVEAASRTATISKRMWYRFEQGSSKPGSQELCEIADVCDRSTDWLLGRVHTPTDAA